MAADKRLSGNEIDMVRINPGNFIMGDSISKYNNDSPFGILIYRYPGTLKHEVTITKPYLMSKTVVTQGMWKKVMDYEPWKIGSVGNAFLGVLLIAKGHFSKGLEILQKARQLYLNNERKSSYVTVEYLLGKVYLQIVAGEEKISLLIMAKNIGFVVKNVPFAAKKSEDHFNKAIEVSKEIGAKGIMGLACLDLGLLHKAKKRSVQAKESIAEAIHIFEECEAGVYLKQAKDVLASLG